MTIALNNLGMPSRYKISVIVPIYEVEQYLKQCVDSIVNQSYTDLEIILVNDGSTDHCPQICDEYANTDSRIKVIHKINGGLSEAKNAGLNASIGEMIIFVDGDDFISPDMLKKMIEELEKSKSDMVICDYYRVESNRNIPIHHEINNKKILTKNEAMKLVLAEKISSHSWNKLCKSHLYKEVYFPVGVTFEDLHETYKLFIDCEKVAYLEDCLYYYRINDQGISLGFNPRRSFHIYLAFKDRLEFAKLEYPECIDICTKYAIETGINVYNNELINISNHITREELWEIVRYIIQNKKNIFTSKEIFLKQKIQVLILSINIKLYDSLYRLYNSYKIGRERC